MLLCPNLIYASLFEVFESLKRSPRVAKKLHCWQTIIKIIFSVLLLLQKDCLLHIVGLGPRVHFRICVGCRDIFFESENPGN